MERVAGFFGGIGDGECVGRGAVERAWGRGGGGTGEVERGASMGGTAICSGLRQAAYRGMRDALGAAGAAWARVALAEASMLNLWAIFV
jgi:hypothetical protein